jgi:hypothetical protein
VTGILGKVRRLSTSWTTFLFASLRGVRPECQWATDLTERDRDVAPDSPMRVWATLKSDGKWHSDRELGHRTPGESSRAILDRLATMVRLN